MAFLNHVLSQLNEAKAQNASMDMIKKAFDEVEHDLSLQALLEEREAFIVDTQRLLARIGVTSQDSVMFLNGKLIEYNSEQVSPKSIVYHRKGVSNAMKTIAMAKIIDDGYQRANTSRCTRCLFW